MELGETAWGGVDWISLAQDRDRWRALVNVVMKLQVQQNTGKLSNFRVASQLVASQVVFSPIVVQGPQLDNDELNGASAFKHMFYRALVHLITDETNKMLCMILLKV
jgi:hypothetical protein